MDELTRAFTKYFQMSEAERVLFRREIKRRIDLAQEAAADIETKKVIEKAMSHD